jgi:DNA-binding MarR family transcriptional regulator
VRDKNFNTGVRGVLLDAGHYDRMGSALWLYSWLVLRQTHQTGSIGWVLGGAPVSYREIEEETGFNRRTLEGWLRRLRREGYIETQAAPTGVVIRITKAKKYSQTARRIADRLRQAAERPTPNCVPTATQNASNQPFAARIGSSSLVGIKEKEKGHNIHRNLHKEIHNTSPFSEENPPGLGKPTAEIDRDAQRARVEQIRRRAGDKENERLSAREFLELLRWERDEEARRELHGRTEPERRCG